jgi:hypothetical protein
MSPYAIPAPVSLPPVPWVTSPPTAPAPTPQDDRNDGPEWRPLSGCTCADWEGEE